VLVCHSKWRHSRGPGTRQQTFPHGTLAKSCPFRKICKSLGRLASASTIQYIFLTLGCPVAGVIPAMTVGVSISYRLRCDSDEMTGMPRLSGADPSHCVSQGLATAQLLTLSLLHPLRDASALPAYPPVLVPILVELVYISRSRQTTMRLVHSVPPPRVSKARHSNRQGGWALVVDSDPARSSFAAIG